MLAAIDIHKAVFQTAVLNPDDGEVLAEERFKASRERLVAWIEKWDGKLDAVAIEATTGWRWVTRELQARGIDVRLTDPGQASALQGNRKRPKTDRLDARWLVLLLARELLPDAWAPPQEIQRLRDKTRCASRSQTTTPDGRSACTRCSSTRAGHAHADRCSPPAVGAGSPRSACIPALAPRSTRCSA